MVIPSSRAPRSPPPPPPPTTNDTSATAIPRPPRTHRMSPQDCTRAVQGLRLWSMNRPQKPGTRRSPFCGLARAPALALAPVLPVALAARSLRLGPWAPAVGPPLPLCPHCHMAGPRVVRLDGWGEGQSTSCAPRAGVPGPRGCGCCWGSARRPRGSRPSARTSALDWRAATAAP